jgi:hypothetical protein
MDWIEGLPEKIKVSLEKLVDTVNRHEDVYMEAENASVGQIWVALAMMNQRVEKLEEMVTAQRKAMNEAGVEVDKRLDENLEKSLRNY